MSRIRGLREEADRTELLEGIKELRYPQALEQPLPSCSAVRPSNDITLVLPERAYEELTVDDPDVETPPVNASILEGWATFAPLLEFSESIVSRSMDGVVPNERHEARETACVRSWGLNNA